MHDTPCVCARCAAIGPTCCRTDPTGGARCFPLSEAEKERIAPHAAARNLPSAVPEENSPEFLRCIRTLFPDKPAELARAFPPGKTHWRLPLDAAGDCVFLEAAGCALPRGARPWYCQLFPLWVRENRFDRFVPEACLLTREAPRLRDVFTALGMEKEEAVTIYLSLCQDWGIGNNVDA